MISESLKITARIGVPLIVGATMASAMFTAWPLVDYFYDKTRNLTPAINEVNYLMQYSAPVTDTTRYYTRGSNWIIIKDYEESINIHTELFKMETKLEAIDAKDRLRNYEN